MSRRKRTTRKPAAATANRRPKRRAADSPPEPSKGRHPKPPPTSAAPPRPQTTSPPPPVPVDVEPVPAAARPLPLLPTGDGWIPVPLEELLERMEAEPQPPPSAPRTPAALITGVAALLVGLAAGWQSRGLGMVLGTGLDPLPATGTMLAVLTLLAAAVGPWLPVRVLPALSRAIERRREPCDGEQPSLRWLRGIRERDEPLLWLSLALAASAAGIVAFATSPLASGAMRIHQVCLEQFFWTNLTLATFEWALAALVSAPLWIVNGLLAIGLVHVAGLRLTLTRSAARVTAGLVLGWSTAGITSGLPFFIRLSGQQHLLLGTLPMFLVAGLAVVLSHRAEQTPDDAAHPEPDAPELAGKGDRLIRWAMVVCTAGIALSSIGRMACETSALSAASAYRAGPHVGLLAVGVGFLTGAWGLRRRRPTTSGCGMSLWFAGVATGGCVMAAAAGPPTQTLSWLVLLLMAPTGYALAYAQAAWLGRAISRGTALAEMGSAQLGGAAIGLIAGEWVVVPLLGPLGALAVTSLLLMASGGLIQIYSDDRAAGVRHGRLALVFASLAGAILLFPAGARQWSRWAFHRYPSVMRVEPDWLVSQAPEGSRLFCLVGCQGPRNPPGAAQLDAPPALLVLHYAYAPASAAALADGEWTAAGNASRHLKTSRTRYDLIYQSGPVFHDWNRAGYSIEWFGRLAACRASGGRILVDVPLDGLSESAALIIARTFEQAAGLTCRWRFSSAGGKRVLRLLAAEDGESTPGGEGWRALSELPGGAASVRFHHSVARDRLSGLIR